MFVVHFNVYDLNFTVSFLILIFFYYESMYDNTFTGDLENKNNVTYSSIAYYNYF